MQKVSAVAAVSLVLLSFRPACSPISNTDLAEIRERGKLIAITGYDATSYFIYKGRPMGYEFELLSLLANHLGVKLEIMISKDRDELFRLLKRGEGDILAANLTVTAERAEDHAFTEYLMTTRQVLIQRKPDGWEKMKLHEIDESLIRNPIHLAGKKIHVREGSAYYDRLQNLSAEIGGGIGIVPAASDVSTEELIRQVAEGEIAYTVADENIAMINLAYYPAIDIATPLSFPQQIAWALRDEAPELLQAINSWIREAKKGVAYHAIYEKYYLSRRGFRERLSGPLSGPSAKLSPYDDLLMQRAAVIGWDWLLLASQVYQESLFDPFATSWAGAVGLMQLLPETAISFGAVNIGDPTENLVAGTNYLKWLEEHWALIPDSTERKKFVLASYNVGYGHVEDARRLAAKFGADHNKWEGHVATFLLKLSNQLYYSDEVVRNGYCRGQEPVSYVEEIFERYGHYRKFVMQAA